MQCHHNIFQYRYVVACVGSFLALLISCSSVFGADNSDSHIPKKFAKSVIKCEQRLKQAPNNSELRKTLARQYIKIAQSLKSDPNEAIKFLHKADSLSPGDPTVTDNLNEIIRRMSKNPLSFSDRAEIARQARKKADFTSAIGEYSRVLQIKPSARMHEELGDVYRVRDENNQAIEQYLKAQTFGDTASLEVKLGQAYQAKKDMTKAIAAYRKAETLKTDDPLVEEALVAGWEEALRPDKQADEAMNQNTTPQNLADFSELISCIKKSWIPPKRDVFKTAKISARFFRDGRLTDLKTVFSSGDSTFDYSARRAIERLKKAGHGLALASLTDGSNCTIEFQHIIGGPKIVMITNEICVP